MRPLSLPPRAFPLAPPPRCESPAIIQKTYSSESSTINGKEISYKLLKFLEKFGTYFATGGIRQEIYIFEP